MKNTNNAYSAEIKNLSNFYHFDFEANDFCKMFGFKTTEPMPAFQERMRALNKAIKKWKMQQQQNYPEKVKEATMHISNCDLYKNILADENAMRLIYNYTACKDSASDEDSEDFFGIISSSMKLQACDVNFYFNVVRSGENLRGAKKAAYSKLKINGDDNQNPEKYHENSKANLMLAASDSIGIGVTKNILRAENILKDIQRELGITIRERELKVCSECTKDRLEDFLMLNNFDGAAALKDYVAGRQQFLNQKTMEMEHSLDRPLDVYNTMMEVIKSPDFERKFEVYRTLIKYPEYLPYMIVMDKIKPESVNMLSTKFGYFQSADAFVLGYLKIVATAMNVDTSAVSEMIKTAEARSASINRENKRAEQQRRKVSEGTYLSPVNAVIMALSLIPFAVSDILYHVLDLFISKLKYIIYLGVPAEIAALFFMFNGNTQASMGIGFIDYFKMFDARSRMTAEIFAAIFIVLSIFIFRSFSKVFAQLPGMYDMKGMRNTFKLTFTAVRRYYSYRSQRPQKSYA